MLYSILIEQTRTRLEEIEAESLQEAREKAMDGVDSGEFDMDDPETIYETDAVEYKG